MDWQARTKLLLSPDQTEKLSNAKVLVVGLGGVGAYAAEMMVRAGLGEITIVDGDSIHATNRNRQLLALKSTEEKGKALLMADRIKDINPDIKVHIVDEYIRDEKIYTLLDTPHDYVIDAIDTLAPKVHLIRICMEKSYPLISSMGSGGKSDPSTIRIADISKSYNCNLARMLRKRLHKMNIYKGFKVVFSTEKTDPNSIIPVENEANKKTSVGTISYMPPLFGCYCAAEVIRDITGLNL